MMTAMAQPLSGIDASHTDAMELFQDTGFGAGEGFAVDDGDIEIDFGPDEGAGNLADDAISLQDVAAEGDAEHQDAPGDADDDYMVDKDDLIEEDEVDYDDLELEDADRPAADDQHEDAGQVNTAPSTHGDEQIAEEDLIDYSDEEDQQEEAVADAGADDPDDSNVQVDVTFEETEAGFDHSAQAAPAGTEAFGSGERDETYEHQGVDDVQEIDPTQQLWDVDESANLEEHSGSQHEQLSQTRPDASIDDRRPGPAHQEQEKADSIHQQPEEKVEARQGSEHPAESLAQQDENFEANEEEPGSAQDDGALPMHPVTLNYDGAELWLFKVEDSQDGEWLLEDESIASQPFVYLLHACRAQLGDDVNSETEIGIRFDNFHGLELYEDSTACACTSLKEFVDIYTTLHAQDGQMDPEPLYVTLQFRPRVSTLIGELKRAVQDQVGFTGLENAIAAGQTSFSSTFYPEEQWDNEGEEGAGAEDGHEEAEGDDTFHLDEQNQGTDMASAREHSAAAERAAEAAEAGADPTGQTEPNAHDIAAPGGEEKNASPAGSYHTELAPEDIIDYSDDEGEDDADQDGKVPSQQASSASSTVQGDEPDNDQSASQGHTNDATRHIGDADGEGAYHDTQDGVNIEEEADYAEYTQDGLSHNAESIVDDGAAEAYGQEDYEDADYSGQALDPESYNDYYGDDGNADMSRQNDASLINEPGDLHGEGTYEDAAAHTEDAYEGVDEFVELVGEEMFDEDPSGNTSNDIVDEIDYDDEEDAPEQDKTNAVSVAVPPSVEVSNGLDDQGSPQGQKRPHDEIDGGLDGASDTTGWFGPGDYYYTTESDMVYPDSKRPKL